MLAILKFQRIFLSSKCTTPSEALLRVVEMSRAFPLLLGRPGKSQGLPAQSQKAKLRKRRCGNQAERGQPGFLRGRKY